MAKTTKKNEGKGRQQEEQNLLNTLLSSFDPELRRFATRLERLAPDFMKGELFDRGFGVFKAWVEGKSNRLPPILGALIEKASDLGDAFSSAVDFEKEGGGETVTREKWVDEMVKDAFERLKKAPTTDAAEVEFAKIKREFELRMQFVEFIKAYEAAMNPPKNPRPPERPLEEVLRDGLSPFLKDVKCSLKKAAARRNGGGR